MEWRCICGIVVQLFPDHLNFKSAQGSHVGEERGWVPGELGAEGRREIKEDITQQCLLLRNREGAKGRKPRKKHCTGNAKGLQPPVSPLQGRVSPDPRWYDDSFWLAFFVFNNSRVDWSSCNLILLMFLLLLLLLFFRNLVSLFI